jgi:hypothetical protein
MTETMEPTRRTESDNILWNRKQYTCIKGPQCTVRSCPPRRLYSDSSKMLSTEFWCIRKVGGGGLKVIFLFLTRNGGNRFIFIATEIDFWRFLSLTVWLFLRCRLVHSWCDYWAARLVTRKWVTLYSEPSWDGLEIESNCRPGSFRGHAFALAYCVHVWKSTEF